MHRKDYTIIAAAFAERMDMAEHFSSTRGARIAHYREIAATLAEKLAADNASFDRSKFMKACGFHEFA